MKARKMTADEARTFNGVSTSNYQAVEVALGSRGCQSCKPYEDVFTLPRWNAQGYRVRKGEKCIPVTVWIPIGAELPAQDDGGDEGEALPRRRMRPKTARLFCRCQVHEASRQKVAA